MTPTSRSLAFLRRQGFTVDVVERWIPGKAIRCDFLGFADLLAFHPAEKRFLLIQTTSTGVSERRRKILERRTAEAKAWLRAGGEIELHGWRRILDATGTRRWSVRVDTITLEDTDLVCDRAPRPPVHRRPRDPQLAFEL